jgi:hypothetical protein
VTIDNTEQETNTRGKWGLKDVMSGISYNQLLSRRRLLKHPGLHPIRHHRWCQAAAPAQRRQQLQLAAPASPLPAHRKMALRGAVCGITRWELVSVWVDASISVRSAKCVWGGSGQCQQYHQERQAGMKCTRWFTGNGSPAALSSVSPPRRALRCKLGGGLL